MDQLHLAERCALETNFGGIGTYNAAVPGVVQTRASAGKHVILFDQFTGFPTSKLGYGVHPNQAGHARGVRHQARKYDLAGRERVALGATGRAT